MATEDLWIPTNEELTVEEVNLSSPALRAGAFHMGKYCENQNNVSPPSGTSRLLHHHQNIEFSFQEYMLCKAELKDPRQCLAEGRAVTACALDFFRKVKKTCYDEFTQHANCLDKSSGDLNYKQ